MPYEPVVGFQPELRDKNVGRPARGVDDERFDAKGRAQVDLFAVQVRQLVVLRARHPEFAVAHKGRVHVHNVQPVVFRALHKCAELFFRNEFGVGIDMYVLESGLPGQAHLFAQVHFGNRPQVNAKTFGHFNRLSCTVLLPERRLFIFL